MITPTIGRIMLYWRAKPRGEKAYASIVTDVVDEHRVDLWVFPPGYSESFPATDVPIVQDGSPFAAGDSHYAEWMPYQKAVAAGDIVPTRHAAGGPLFTGAPTMHDAAGVMGRGTVPKP